MYLKLGYMDGNLNNMDGWKLMVKIFILITTYSVIKAEVRYVLTTQPRM